jgi:hypothetical protein
MGLFIMKKIVIATLVALLSVSMVLVPAFSTPTNNIIVVRLDNDSAVNSAIQTLEKNIPNVQIVDFGSLDYYLNIWKTVNSVIWVSHGSQAGILIHNKIVPWNSFASILKSVPGKNFVLSCDSGYLLSETGLSKNIFTFNSIIDAKLGSLIVSYAFSRSNALLTQIFDRATNLIQIPSSINPLYYDFNNPNSLVAFTMDLVNVMTLVLAVISLTGSIIAQTFQAGIAWLNVARAASYYKAFFDFIYGIYYLNFDLLFGGFTALANPILSICWSGANKLWGWAAGIIFGSVAAETSAEYAAYIAAGGIPLWLKIVEIAVAGSLLMYNAWVFISHATSSYVVAY